MENKHSTKTFIIAQTLCLFIGSFSIGYSASLQDLETTRLKSTAGTGVGSLLVEEATVLNPAPLAFYNLSSVYLLKSGIDIKNENDLSGRANQENSTTAAILTDTKSRVKGSFSYYKQIEGFNQRKQFAVSMATNAGSKSSLGVTYINRKEVLSENGSLVTEKKTNQINFGITHAISEAITLGFVITDPFQENENDTKAIIGAQFSYKNFITLMTDIGADYSDDPATSLNYGAALQFKIIETFYLRFGASRDTAKEEKANGIGLSWVQPKLTLEAALKNSETEESLEKNIEAEKFAETSFSLSYRF